MKIFIIKSTASALVIILRYFMLLYLIVLGNNNMKQKLTFITYLITSFLKKYLTKDHQKFGLYTLTRNS